MTSVRIPASALILSLQELSFVDTVWWLHPSHMTESLTWPCRPLVSMQNQSGDDSAALGIIPTSPHFMRWWPPPLPLRKQHRIVRVHNANKEHTHARTHTYTHTHAHTRTHAHVRTRAHARTRTHARTHTHTRARAHKHTHTHTWLKRTLGVGVGGKF